MSNKPPLTGMVRYVPEGMRHSHGSLTAAREAYYRAARAEIDRVAYDLEHTGKHASLAAILAVLTHRGAVAPNGGPLTRAHIKRFREHKRPGLLTTKGVPQMRLEWRTYPKSGGGFERRKVRVAVGNPKRYTTRKEL